MPKLEDLLKSRGYTDADLTAMKPMLDDAKFRGAIEDSITGLESAKAAAEKESQEWSTWHQTTAIPTLDKYMNEAETARTDAASVREKLKIAQERGLKLVAEEQNPEPPPDPGRGEKFDPKKHNLVTMDDARQFLDAEGEAIATAQDIALEYFELFGKPLSYTAQDGSKGFRALRKEAIAAKRPVYDFVQEKFKFGDRRSELAQQAKADEEKRIRADERSKNISEFGNPMARSPQASTSPFSRPAAGGKQPWEDSTDRSEARLDKVLKHVLQ